jgi:hypothetical protein
MNYYIKTEGKELSEATLSETFKTYESANEHLQKLHKKNKEKSTVVSVPELKIGLVLYNKASGKYYKTITKEDDILYFTKKDPLDKTEISSPVRKEKMIQWFTDGQLRAVEEYNTDVKVDTDLFLNEIKSDVVYTEDDQK